MTKRPPRTLGPGNGRLGLLDVDEPSAALLASRFRLRGHGVTRLSVPPRPLTARDALVFDDSATWIPGQGWTIPSASTAGGMPIDLHAVIPTGRRPSPGMLPADDRTPVLIAHGLIDLDDELSMLLWLADHDVEVPRILGRSRYPIDLLDALPTDGPVLVAHAGGDVAWARRSCRRRVDLEGAIRAASQISGAGDFYLLEDVGGDDAIVTGVFRSGEPLVWGARTADWDDDGRLIGLGPVETGRLFEVAEEAAGQLELDGPAELHFRTSGGEAHLLGLVPVVTWTLLSLGSEVDDALGSALARLGVPCADRPPNTPGTNPMPRWQPVAPQRAWSTSPGLSRVARSAGDPVRLPPGTPSDYRRWAWRTSLSGSSPAPNERSRDHSADQ